MRSFVEVLATCYAYNLAKGFYQTKLLKDKSYDTTRKKAKTKPKRFLISLTRSIMELKIL